jgi:hypothetical protein
MSIYLFKTAYQKTETPIINIPVNSPLYRDIKNSFFGGNTSVFNTGALEIINIKSPPILLSLDFPGRYANVIIKTKLPYGNPYVYNFHNSILEKERLNLLEFCNKNNYIFISKVQVSVPDRLRQFPPLPE